MCVILYDDMAIQCCMERDHVFCLLIWVFPKIKAPQNGWFIMENPIKMDYLGGKPTIFGNTHICSYVMFHMLIGWFMNGSLASHAPWLVVSQWRLFSTLDFFKEMAILESHTTLIILGIVFSITVSPYTIIQYTYFFDDPMYVAHFQVTSPEVPGGTGQLFRVVPQDLDPDDGCEMLWCWCWWW